MRIKREKVLKSTRNSSSRCYYAHFERFLSRIHPEMVKWRNLCPNAQIQELYSSPPPRRLSQKLFCGLPRANQNRGCSEILFHTSISEKISTTPRAIPFTLLTKRTHTHTHQIYVRCNRSSLPTAFSRRARSASSDLQTP